MTMQALQYSDYCKCTLIYSRSSSPKRQQLTVQQMKRKHKYIHHTHPFNGPWSGSTQVSRYQKGKTNLDFTEAKDSEWQWHSLGYMQVCTSLHTDNHASTPPLKVFYRPDALPATQLTVTSSKSINRLLIVRLCLW